MRRRVIALLCAAAIGSGSSAYAQFGGVVYDPTNHVQTILTAARNLQQIRNQVRQLQNEADMLVAEAKNLSGLAADVSPELATVLSEIDALVAAGTALSFEIAETDRLFREGFPHAYAEWTASGLAAEAETRWRMSRDAFQEATLVQSRIVEAVREDGRLLQRLVAESQRAEGDLSVSQAGNQLLALQAKQAMQMQSLLATQGRADALERARQLQDEREAEARHRRFIGSNSAYADGGS